MNYKGKCVSSYTLGKGNVDNFTKLSKIVFSVKYFTVDFSRFSGTNVKI